VTPVAAFQVNSGTTTAGVYTATLSGSPGTNTSVTLVTGTTALVTIRAYMDNTGNNFSRTSVAVSGASTIAATDNYCVGHYKGSLATLEMGTTVIVPGLTPGTNTFTLQYNNGAGTGTFADRGLTVQGIA